MSFHVLHATESLASGVMDLLATITKRQVDEGADVTVIFAARPDTPPDFELQQIFDSRVRLVQASAPSDTGRRAAFALRKALFQALESAEYDAVHLHSTVAGMLGRFGPGARKHRSRVYYSPHGFGFLRQDLPSAVRRGVLVAERLAARRSHLVLSTQSEADIATEMVKAPRTSIVVNGIDTEALPTARGHAGGKLRVAMVGRVVYQKAPWVFARIANELHNLADFTWFGDGDSADIDRWLADSPVTIIGRMPLSELRIRLADVDVFLFPTLWEGMPLSLMEAQCIGVPAIATRIVGNKDIVVDGTSGFLCDSEEELLSRARQVLLDGELRSALSAGAINVVRTRFDNRTIGAELLAIYGAATTSVVRDGAQLDLDRRPA